MSHATKRRRHVIQLGEQFGTIAGQQDRHERSELLVDERLHLALPGFGNSYPAFRPPPDCVRVDPDERRCSGVASCCDDGLLKLLCLNHDSPESSACICYVQVRACANTAPQRRSSTGSARYFLGKPEGFLEQILAYPCRSMQNRCMSTNFLTTEQVADRYGLSVWGVRRMVRAKKLRAVNIGTDRRHILRFDPADLAKFEQQAAA